MTGATEEQTKNVHIPNKSTYVTIAKDESIHDKFEKAVETLRGKLGASHPMLIGGVAVRSEEGEFEVRSPIDTRIVVGRFQKATKAHYVKAIQTARKELRSWAAGGYEQKVRIFNRAAEILEERAFDVAAAISFEVGKSRQEALAEVFEVVDWFRYYCDQLQEQKGYATVMNSPVPGEHCLSVMRPYGVWCVISPFNFPLALANNMCAGALMMGNTVVLKPSSASPLVALDLYWIYRDAGVPAGAINFLTGGGRALGEELATNPSVDGVAFVGSKAVGAELLSGFTKGQAWPKPFIAEMGSKNPCLVTANADVEKAAQGVARGAFGFQGQKCSATSRVYVDRKISQSFIECLVRTTASMKVGSPFDRTSYAGPVIDKGAQEKFEEWVAKAEQEGGKVLVGGKAPREGDLANGYYVEPTVITGLPAEHPLFKEELFLPVLAVAEVESFEEGLALANDTEYGLTAGIFSEDQKELRRFFDEIEFGVCYANRAGGATTGAWPGAQSFVGWKASGSTGKGVLGPHYLQGFAREQSRTVAE